MGSPSPLCEQGHPVKPGEACEACEALLTGTIGRSFRKLAPPMELLGRFAKGDALIVTDDLGRRWNTAARSAPWRLGDGTIVALIEGIAGGYLAERLTPGHDPDLRHFRDRRREPKPAVAVDCPYCLNTSGGCRFCDGTGKVSPADAPAIAEAAVRDLQVVPGAAEPGPRDQHDSAPAWFQAALLSGATAIEAGEHGFYSVEAKGWAVTDADAAPGWLAVCWPARLRELALRLGWDPADADVPEPFALAALAALAREVAHGQD